MLGDGTATGQFPGSAGYMMARTHRHPRLPADEWVERGGPVEVSRTRVDPRAVA
ncbi:hypothetical protein GCM10022214_00720 [Actinomadura miaoliensis]|uniref:Uncharacterized protein n=1 Tax=Actinomadura miaoliensis TaxID=430685 RepID=A0ABP7UVR5_9ACTN